MGESEMSGGGPPAGANRGFTFSLSQDREAWTGLTTTNARGPGGSGLPSGTHRWCAALGGGGLGAGVQPTQSLRSKTGAQSGRDVQDTGCNGRAGGGKTRRGRGCTARSTSALA